MDTISVMDFVEKYGNYPRDRRELIKSVIKKTFKRHYQREPQNLLDATEDLLGTIDISINETIKYLKKYNKKLESDKLSK